MDKKYDLMLRGGEVVDPSQGRLGVRDVAFKDGKVAAVEPSIDPSLCEEVISVKGKLVTPGLIDLHGHFAYRISPGRANPDPTNLAIGVTTAIDAGSTGWMNFPGFRSYVIEKVDTRLLAFIHLSSIGTMPGTIGIPDLGDFRYARSEEAIGCIEENRDLLLGMKVRLTPNGTTLKNAVPALKMARGICDQTDTQMMVHVMESPISLPKVFEHMHAGDIATHIFHGDVHNVLDSTGKISAEVWEAYESGIVFDTACFAKPLRHPHLPPGHRRGAAAPRAEHRQGGRLPAGAGVAALLRPLSAQELQPAGGDVHIPGHGHVCGASHRAGDQ